MGKPGGHHRLVFSLLTAYDSRVPNQYEEYAKLPHFFFAFPGRDLEKLNKEYFEKTAKGIQWVMT